MIACLGWGSLIWDPKELPLTNRRPEAWQDDGPELPLEFARVSKNGRLTLVIDPASAAVRVLWNSLRVASLADAVEALQMREGVETDRPIGRWRSDYEYPFADVIGRWAHSRELKGVVWTALGPRFNGRSGQRPSQDEAVEYLAGLSNGPRCLAEQYVRCAPLQIDTLYRRAIIDALGWSATRQ